jgi:YD repeat-containing protein
MFLKVVERETLNTEKKTLQVEDGNGDKVEYLIRDDGSPQNITDSAGNVFSFIYDNTSTLLSESRFPDGSKETFGYDSQDNLKKRTTRNGRDIIFENGADGKMVRKYESITFFQHFGPT